MEKYLNYYPFYYPKYDIRGGSHGNMIKTTDDYNRICPPESNQHLWYGEVPIQQLMNVVPGYANNVNHDTFHHRWLTPGLFAKSLNSNDPAFLEKAILTRGVAKFGVIGNDIISNNKTKFDSPLGIHYNPYRGRFDVHPGSSRIQIVSALNLKTVDLWVFNTGGFYDPILMKGMQPLKEVDLPLYTFWFNVDPTNIICQPGNIFESGDWQSTVVAFYEKQYAYWIAKQRRIYFNKLNPHLELTFERKITKNPTLADIEVTLKPEAEFAHHDKITGQVMIALLSLVDYDTDIVTVKFLK